MTKENFPFNQRIAWHPNQQWIDDSNLVKFIRDHQLKDYEDLMKRSTTDYGWFWDSVLKDLDIQFFQSYEKIIDLKRMDLLGSDHPVDAPYQYPQAAVPRFRTEIVFERVWRCRQLLDELSVQIKFNRFDGLFIDSD